MNRLPRNFLNRYNKYAGVIQLSDLKYLLYTTYTFCVLDLSAEVPESVEMVQNHPTRTTEGKHLVAETWFDNLKLSQAKYLTANDRGETQAAGSGQANLAINNRFKGILQMEYVAGEKKLRVIEH